MQRSLFYIEKIDIIIETSSSFWKIIKTKDIPPCQVEPLSNLGQSIEEWKESLCNFETKGKQATWHKQH